MKVYPFNTVGKRVIDDGSEQMTPLDVSMEKVAITVAFVSVFGFFFKLLFF
jgi:hypothetical protein